MNDVEKFLSVRTLSDWDLWKLYSASKEQFECLEMQVRNRGLFTKPFCEFSNLKPNIEDTQNV